MTLFDRFQSHRHELARFDKISHKLSNYTDVHAIMLLDRILFNTGHSSSLLSICTLWECPQVKLPPDIKITDEQIIELLRCGVDCSTDSSTLLF